MRHVGMETAHDMVARCARLRQAETGGKRRTDSQVTANNMLEIFPIYIVRERVIEYDIVHVSPTQYIQSF